MCMVTDDMSHLEADHAASPRRGRDLRSQPGMSANVRLVGTLVRRISQMWQCTLCCARAMVNDRFGQLWLFSPDISMREQEPGASLSLRYPGLGCACPAASSFQLEGTAILATVTSTGMVFLDTSWELRGDYCMAGI